MAVPKKRTSKSKKNLRKSIWKKKAKKQAIQAYFLVSRASKKIGLENSIPTNIGSESSDS